MAVSRPAAGNVTQPFGKQPNGSWHWGTDFGWGSGSTVYAMLAGTVAAVDTLADYGKVIVLEHGHDTNGDLIRSRYCHLSKQNVTVGQQIPAGAAIGVMGLTGSLTKQVHLHSELWVNGVRRDQSTYNPPAPQPVLDTSTMKLVKYAGPGITNLLITDNGAYALNQAYADVVYRFLINTEPTAADTNLVTAILYGQRWSPSGIVPSILAEGTMPPIDLAALAAAVELQMADEFAALNANIDDQPTEFNITPTK